MSAVNHFSFIDQSIKRWVVMAFLCSGGCCALQAQTQDKDVARVHSGDPSLYGAVAEQIRRLKALGIDYEIVPGVSAYAAAAASLGIELTVPEVTQTLILTRTAMKSSAMPAGGPEANPGRANKQQHKHTNHNNNNNNNNNMLSNNK